MESLFELDIAFILFLQSLGEWLVAPMKLITYLGNEEFYLFVAPAVYWCWDTALGLRFGLYFLTSASFNGIFKLILHSPRPYWTDPRVLARYTETSFGLPSGHAQNATVVWGGLAAWFNTRWAWVTGGILIFLIGLSRPILGVHFTIDMLLGWTVGALLLWALLHYEKRILDWLLNRKLGEQIVIVLAASLSFILAGALLRLALADWQIPAAWSQNAAAAAPEADPINPLSIEGLISSSAAFFGLALGGLLTQAYGRFHPGGPALKRVARFLLGLVGVFLFWFVLGELFPGGEDLLSYALRFLRYSLVTLWVAFLAPQVFLRLGLVEPN